MPHVFFAVAAALPVFAFSAFDLELAFRPFEYLDFSGIYERFSGVIDFVIVALIFVGLAQATLGRRFPGRAGRAVSIGTGLMLALGLVAVEQGLGISLKSFGPVAAMLLILLLGIMIYRMLHYAGLSRPTSAAAAYIAIFLTMLGIAPEFFRWVSDEVPWLATAFIILAILALIALAFSFAPTHFPGGAFGRTHQPSSRNADQPQTNANAVREEKRFIKHGTKPAAYNVAREAKETLRDLDAIDQAIRRGGNDPRQVPRIINAVQATAPKEEDLRRRIENLKRLNQRLMQEDVSVLSSQSHQSANVLPPRIRGLLTEEMRDEIKRVSVEEYIDRIEATAQRYLTQTTRCLRDVVTALRSGRIREALRAVKKARSFQEGIARLTDIVRRLEQYLLAVTKRDIKIEKEKGS